MAESTPVELEYEGTEVEDGTVPVNDMVDALVGFSSAYGKIARRQQSPDTGHRIRVIGLRKGSAKILVDVVEWTAKNPLAAGVLVSAAGMVGTGAYRVIKDIAGVIKGKKALQGQTITNNSYTFNDNRVMIQGVELTLQQFEYLQSGELDPDLDKLTAPLEEGRGADEFMLKTGEEELVRVSSEERPFFAHTEVGVTVTKDDIWLEGELFSHSKRNNRGMFHTVSGKHIPYHYIGDDVQPLWRGYAYSGIVKVLGRVRFSADLEPIFIEIRDVQLGQQILFEPKDTQ